MVEEHEGASIIWKEERNEQTVQFKLKVRLFAMVFMNSLKPELHHVHKKLRISSTDAEMGEGRFYFAC